MPTSTANAVWIGGPPGSGKTAVATHLARRHGLRWYNADTRTWGHRDRALRAGHAAAQRWESMTPDKRWVTATPEEIAELTLDRERGRMIAEDVARLPRTPMIVAEVSPLRPTNVADADAGRWRSVWLLPRFELLRERLEAHGLRGDVSDPHRARENAVRRALLDTAEIERQARSLAIVELGGSQAIEETVALVKEVFAEALAAGPLAEIVAERRALLRDANEAVVSQMLAYFARPWVEGDVESAVRPFLCECADPDCDPTVERPVTALPDEPLLAPGHA